MSDLTDGKVWPSKVVCNFRYLDDNVRKSNLCNEFLTLRWLKRDTLQWVASPWTTQYPAPLCICVHWVFLRGCQSVRLRLQFVRQMSPSNQFFGSGRWPWVGSVFQKGFGTMESVFQCIWTSKSWSPLKKLLTEVESRSIFWIPKDLLVGK